MELSMVREETFLAHVCFGRFKHDSKLLRRSSSTKSDAFTFVASRRRLRWSLAGQTLLNRDLAWA